MMIRLFLAMLLCLIPAAVHAEDTLVAHWAFDDGTGTRLKDSVGNSDGVIKGAKWIASGKGFALSFDGVDDRVDCGDAPAIDLRGPMTLEAWIKPDAPPKREPGVMGKSFASFLLTYYQTGSAYFYVNDGGNGAEGPIKVGAWSHVAAMFDGKRIRFYVNGMEKGSRDSKFDKIAKGGRFFIGVVPADPSAADESVRNTEHFRGAIDEVKLYKEARSARQIAESFNAFAEEKGLKTLAATDLAELAVEVFPYPERNSMVISANFARLSGLGDEATASLDLKNASGETVESQTQRLKTPQREAEFLIDTTELGNGKLVATVKVTSGSLSRDAQARIALPFITDPLSDPKTRIADPLPASIASPSYDLQVTPQGGMIVKLGAVSFPVESRFSYPDGGENALATAASTSAEKSFSPKVKQIDAQTWQVTAVGASYRIDRKIRRTATRIEVADTITNLTQDVLGVIYTNGIDTRQLNDVSLSIMPNPTVFAASGKAGLGLIALDDVYQVHQQTLQEDGYVCIRDEHFGVDAGKSYTIEWALYPTASSNYFDFINQVRKDEGLNGHVDGSVELTSRWGAPPADQVANKGLAYVSACYLTHSLQNPHRSLEGWEFVEFPELCDRVTKAIADVRDKFPRVKPMFHVAHSLYFTNQPVEKFGDSVVRDENGKLDFYGPNTLDYYGKYVAPELFNENWRWYLIYPTSTNSFGKHTLSAVDVMIHQLKAGAIWADGFFTAYVKGGYTFDTWDGHSVTIDPRTKRVTRKKAAPVLIGKDVLLEIIRRFERNGGVLISNDKPGPRSFWREKMITSNETGGGDQQPIAGLYLGQTVTPLGNPGAFSSQRSVHRDVLAKLDAGALYFFYGEGDLVKEKSIVSCMYPITFDTIQPGVVSGKERIVTRKSGSFGWADDHSLHAIDLADARGSLRPNRFFATVDASSTRSQVDLHAEEIAVIRKIPVQIQSDQPVNSRVVEYGPKEIRLEVRAQAAVTVLVRNGEFAVIDGGVYPVQVDEEKTKGSTATDGVLAIPLAAGKAVRLTVKQP